MKKKVLFLALVLAATTMFALAWTGAYFTESYSVEGTTVTGGDVELGIGKSLTPVTGLEPGGEWKQAGFISVENIGDLDAKWRMKLGIEEGSPDLSKLLIRCTLQNPGDYGGNYGPSGDTVLWTLTATQLQNWTKTASCAPDTPGGAIPFEPGHKAVYKIEVSLDSSADNSWQGQTVSPDLEFEATQWINPGWTQ